MFFTGWVLYWNASWTYLFFFSIQNIKNNCQTIFLKRFPIVYFWWIIYSFPIIFIYKWFNIWNSFWIPLIDVSGYHERSDLNNSLVTAFTTLQDLIFILSLLECITRSSLASFAEIEFIVIVNWIAYVSEFWRSVIIFLK